MQGKITTLVVLGISLALASTAVAQHGAIGLSTNQKVSAGAGVQPPGGPSVNANAATRIGGGLQASPHGVGANAATNTKVGGSIQGPGGLGVGANARSRTSADVQLNVPR